MIICWVDLRTSEMELWPRAEAAREWFATHGPADAPPLPLDYAERERLKRGGLRHLVAWYACSLALQDFDVEKHPSFDDYACGVMASEHAPYFIKNDEALQKRFPARPLPGLNRSLDWEPPRPRKKKTTRPRRRAAA